mgnify:FL=1
MRTIKRGGQFVWRNYMYNAFERKERDEKEREREKMKIHETEGSDTIYTRMMSFG